MKPVPFVRYAVAALLIALAAPIPLVRAQEPMLQAGTRELALAGYVGDSDGLNFFVSGSGGFFFFDGTELGVIGSYSRSDTSFGDWQSTQVGVFAEQNFDFGGLLVPFVGARLMLSEDNMEGTDSLWVADIGAGLRHFLSPGLSVGFRVDYSKANEPMYPNGTDADGITVVEDSDISGLLETRYYF